MENLFWIGFIGALVAGLFAVVQAKKVLSYSEGSEKMRKIAANIRSGANAYLKQQYTTVFKVFIVVFVILLVIAFATGGKMLSKFTPFAFVTGGIFSMLAGFIGMKIATNSNARTAQAASESLNKGLRVAFSSGSVMGFTVVGLGLLDITKTKLPTLLVIVLLAIFVIPRFAPDTAATDFKAGAQKEQEPLDPFREVVGYATFALVLVGMIFSSKIGLTTWQVAFIGALVIMATGVLSKSEGINAMNLSMVLLYVGALGIGSALSATGAADLIGNALAGVIVKLNNGYLVGLLLFVVPFILTQFMLNSGVYSIFTPLYIMLCKSMGANPIGPIMLCMIACMTAFFTPLATPAVPLMMGAGNYTMKDLVKMGWIPAIVITVVSVGWIMTVYPLF